MSHWRRISSKSGAITMQVQKLGPCIKWPSSQVTPFGFISIRQSLTIWNWSGDEAESTFKECRCKVTGTKHHALDDECMSRAGRKIQLTIFLRDHTDSIVIAIQVFNQLSRAAIVLNHLGRRVLWIVGFWLTKVIILNDMDIPTHHSMESASASLTLSSPPTRIPGSGS